MRTPRSRLSPPRPRGGSASARRRRSAWPRNRPSGAGRVAGLGGRPRAPTPGRRGRRLRGCHPRCPSGGGCVATARPRSRRGARRCRRGYPPGGPRASRARAAARGAEEEPRGGEERRRAATWVMVLDEGARGGVPTTNVPQRQRRTGARARDLTTRGRRASRSARVPRGSRARDAREPSTSAPRDPTRRPGSRRRGCPPGRRARRGSTSGSLEREFKRPPGRPLENLIWSVGHRPTRPPTASGARDKTLRRLHRGALSQPRSGRRTRVAQSSTMAKGASPASSPPRSRRVASPRVGLDGRSARSPARPVAENLRPRRRARPPSLTVPPSPRNSRRGR